MLVGDGDPSLGPVLDHDEMRELVVDARSMVVPKSVAAAYRSSPSPNTEPESERLADMAFGQQSGSPAPAKQVEELLSLLRDAGHADFRDARGPMGFNQRQAAGRFSRDEASAFIEQLQAAAALDPPPPESYPTARAARTSPAEHALRRLPAEQLAAELRRRGWSVTEP